MEEHTKHIHEQSTENNICIKVKEVIGEERKLHNEIICTLPILLLG
jgi:hypothetical protein